MNYSVLIFVTTTYYLCSVVVLVKSQEDTVPSYQIGSDQNRLGYSDWIFNTLNNTSSNTFWTNGMWQMYKWFKPIANFDKRREPNFVTFNAQDSTMTLDLNLGFPFIRIPVANTSNILNLAKDLYRRERPLINFDITAIVMVAMVTLISTLFSITLRSFFKPFVPTNLGKKRDARSTTENFDSIINIFQLLNSALEKYGVNTNVCAQRIVCMYVKNAVIDKKARRSDAKHFNRIIEGLSRSDWALEYVEGTSFQYAINLGRSEGDCQRVFKKCNPDFWFYNTN